MLIANALPPPDDLDLDRLPGRLKIVGLGTFVLGCTCHICLICNQRGHQVVAHVAFLPRGLKHPATEDCLLTTTMATFLKYPFIVLITTACNREAWECSKCQRTEVGSFYFGNGVLSALNHIATLHHQADLSSDQGKVAENSVSPAKLFIHHTNAFGSPFSLVIRCCLYFFVYYCLPKLLSKGINNPNVSFG